MNSNKTYICIDERYSPEGDLFDSVEEFLAYCVACFGYEPKLESINYGDEWIDADTDEVVLRAVNA